MLDINEVLNTIEELENSDTTYENCLKLASLYIVREHFEMPNLAGGNHPETRPSEDVVKELNDILPQYHTYCETKRKYQLKEITKEAVLRDLKEVCRELREFIQTLYSSTDMPQERHIIEGTLADLIRKMN